MDNTEVLNTLLSNARTALNEFESYTQEQVDALIRRVCLDFKAHAEELAREAVSVLIVKRPCVLLKGERK